MVLAAGQHWGGGIYVVTRGHSYPHFIHDGIGTQNVVLLGGVGGCMFDGPRGLTGSRQAHHHQNLQEWDKEGH